MATLLDVAKKAHISKTMVSRVLNNQRGVSEASRERILEAVKELNYVPNGVARSLVLKKTSIIGVIVDSLTEPYFFDLIKGIEHEITKSDYRVIFCSGRNSAELKEQYMEFFSSGRTDGVIIYGSNIADMDILRNHILSNFPLVLVENEPDGLGVNNVVIENEYGSELVTKHLIERGCKDILHVVGSAKVKAALSRQAGYEKAMKKNGLGANIRVILCDDFGVDEGYIRIKSFLSETDRLPDAICFGSDNNAYGGMAALIEAGIHIPGDILITGFDDDKAKFYDLPIAIPPLTTIRQPLYDAGKKAVELLLNQICNPGAGKQKVVLYPELEIRESTRR